MTAADDVTNAGPYSVLAIDAALRAVLALADEWAAAPSVGATQSEQFEFDYERVHAAAKRPSVLDREHLARHRKTVADLCARLDEVSAARQAAGNALRAAGGAR